MNKITSLAAKTPGPLIAGLAVAPIYIAGVTNHGKLATFWILAGIAAFITAMMSGFWTTLALAPAFGLLAAGAVAGSTKPILAGIVMAVGVIVWKVASTRPGGRIAMMTLIFLGMWAVAPPLIMGKVPSASANVVSVGLATLAIFVWMAAVGGIQRAHVPRPPMPKITIRLALWSGALMAIVVGVSTWIVIAHHLGHGGSWLLLTEIIVFQPFVDDPWTKALYRAFGTLLGFCVTYLVIAVIPTSAPSWAFILPALIFFYSAMHIVSGPNMMKHYWIFTLWLTPAIILLEGGTTGHGKVDVALSKLADQRLLFTVIGVVVALVCTAIVYPLQMSYQSRKAAPTPDATPVP